MGQTLPLDDRHVTPDDGVVSPSDRAAFTTASRSHRGPVLKRLSDERPPDDPRRPASGQRRVARGGCSPSTSTIRSWATQSRTSVSRSGTCKRSRTARRSVAAFRRRSGRHASWPERSPGDIDTFVADRAPDAHRLRAAEHHGRRSSRHSPVHPQGVRHLRPWLSR